METKEIYLPDVVGKGYKEFWNFKGRYRVVKGSRASKKSKTEALWIIYNMMKYPSANTLVVRKVFRTIKDSCFTELKWAAHRLGVDHLWEFTVSPIEATYVPTGQKIYFRGLDDPLKVTSITVEDGCLCWVWLEEAYEVMREEDFDMLDESIRGAVPDDLFKQITFTFNPWSDRHWMKRRFYDELVGYDRDGKPIYEARKTPMSPDGEILAVTTNYMCNEWLDAADRKLFDTMKANNPRRYAVAGLGGWGVVDGLVYENWSEKEFRVVPKQEYLKLDAAERERTLYVFAEDVKSTFGLDFGYTNDPTAFFAGFINLVNKKIYVWDEIYEKGLSNQTIHDRITEAGYGKERITADSAEPKSIDELKGLGLRVKGAKKGKDSINSGIQFIQNFEIIIHPRCNNFLTEISNYTWDKDKFGATLNKPIDDFNHLMDAMRYGVEQYISSKGWIF